jgi:uncharacterized membrane protein
MNMTRFIEFYKAHIYEMNGVVIGLVTSVSILLIGLFRFLFIALCVAIGYYIGKKLAEDKEYLKNILDRILPPGSYF